LNIAEKCPVSKILKNNILINTNITMDSMDITKEYTNGELTVYGRLANAFILVIVFAQSRCFSTKGKPKLMLRRLKK
jgi:hypothetical protein